MSESDDPRPTFPWLKLLDTGSKYLLLAIVAGNWIASAALAFSHPLLFADWLSWVDIACMTVLFGLCLAALIRRRWKDLVDLCAISAAVLLLFSDARDRLRWLYVEAFRLHASPLEDYLAQCRLIPFAENGIEHKLGRCETLNVGFDAYVDVFYDTSGEIVLPVSQRTPEWKAAMWHFSPHAVLLEKENRAKHLAGQFYQIVIIINELDGDDERY